MSTAKKEAGGGLSGKLDDLSSNPDSLSSNPDASSYNPYRLSGDIDPVEDIERRCLPNEPPGELAAQVGSVGRMIRISLRLLREAQLEITSKPLKAIAVEVIAYLGSVPVR